MFGVYTFDHYLESTNSYHITYDGTLRALFGGENTAAVRARVLRYEAECDDFDEERTYCSRSIGLEAIFLPSGESLDVHDSDCEKTKGARYTCLFDVDGTDYELALSRPSSAPDIELVHRTKREGSLPYRIWTFALSLAGAATAALGARSLIGFIVREMTQRNLPVDGSRAAAVNGATAASRTIGTLAASLGLFALCLVITDLAVSAVSYLWKVPSLTVGLRFVVLP
jgi:hypothetical protein